MSAKFPRGGGGAGPFLARSLKGRAICNTYYKQRKSALYKVSLEFVIFLEFLNGIFHELMVT